MNFRIKQVLIIAFSTFVMFTACKNPNKQVAYIPQNVASVIVVDMPSVMKKSEARGAKSAEKLLAYFSSYGFSNETFDLAIHSYFMESEKTGLNLNDNIMAYLLPSKEFKNAYKCMSVMLTDSAVFSSYIKSVMSPNYSILEGVDGCVCYLNRNDRFSWIAYNDEVAVFGCSTIHTKGILECVNDIFKTTGKTLANNSDFSDFMKEKKDVSVWFATTEMIDFYSLFYTEFPKLLTLKNIPENALKGNFIHINVDFQKQVNVSLSCTPSRAFKRFWKKNNFTTKTFDQSLCDVLPQNTLWFMTASINPQGFLTQLKDSECCNYAEHELAKLHLTVEDFMNSFTGDCVFSMYDVTFEKVRMFEFVQKNEYKGGTMLWKHFQKDQKTTFPHLAFAFAMKDSTVPNAVLTHISTDICTQIQPGMFDFSKIMGFPAYVICSGKTFVVTTDKEYGQNLLSEKQTVSCSSGVTVGQLAKMADGNASYHYMDFTLKNYPETAIDYFDQMSVLPLLESYSNIVKSAEMVLTDSYTGSMVVDFQDTTKNSLFQLNELMEIVLPDASKN